MLLAGSYSVSSRALVLWTIELKDNGWTNSKNGVCQKQQYYLELRPLCSTEGVILHHKISDLVLSLENRW